MAGASPRPVSFGPLACLAASVLRCARHRAAAGAADSAPAPLAPALQDALTTLLPAIQGTLTRLAEGRSHPDDAGKYARALATLTRTLRELNGLLSKPQRWR